MDERENLPSASAAHRYALCKGSWLLEQQCVDHQRSMTDVLIGNRVHAVMAGEAVPNLSGEEISLIERIRSQEATLVAATFQNQPIHRVIREQRLWATDRDGNKLWSGKPDVVFANEDHALIIDYKTGRGEVEEAAKNLQLRCLVALVDEHFGLGHFNQITVAIIQPLAGQPSVCCYDSKAITQAVREADEIMSAVKLNGQSRTPSEESCKYCKGKPYCPEAREVAVAAPFPNAPLDISPKHLAQTLTDEVLSEFLVKASLAESIIEACREEAKRRLTAGEKLLGWDLKPGAVRETIVDTQTVAERFLTVGTYEQLLPAITFSTTKLKDAVKAATGHKGFELDMKVTQILHGCTESKQTSPTLIRA